MSVAKKKLKSLVIVESPAKSKTIHKILGNDYVIEASYGHVRNLPESTLGFDVNDNFKPTYVIIPEKKKVVNKLNDVAKKCDRIYLASDPDREGEAIAWHLKDVLGIKDNKYKRVLFNEITHDKVIEAIEKRAKNGSRFTILAVAEGAISKEDSKLTKKEYKKKLASYAFPSVSYEIADQIQKKTGREVRVTVPGHMQRGGVPDPYDRVFASRVGVEAGQLILKKEYGYMIAYKNREMVKVPLEEIAGKLKTLPKDSSIIKEAKMLGICFGD